MTIITHLHWPVLAAMFGLTVSGCGTQPFDPDCTAAKAARATAMKATVGVGGRCTPAEAAADSAKRKTGLD
jgi:hypothetical protein